MKFQIEQYINQFHVKNDFQKIAMGNRDRNHRTIKFLELQYLVFDPFASLAFSEAMPAVAPTLSAPTSPEIPSAGSNTSYICTTNKNRKVHLTSFRQINQEIYNFLLKNYL